MRRGGAEAVLAVAAGSPSFKGAHLAAHERWSRALTPHDGLVHGLPEALARKLDPLTSSQTVSASSLARYATCGFQYLLANVLRLEAVVEPEERLGLNALEKGSLFHEVAEEFLRAERDTGRLPVKDDDETRNRLLDLARAHVDRLVAGTPPRHRLVWDMHWRAFCDLLLRFLAREAPTPRSAARRTSRWRSACAPSARTSRTAASRCRWTWARAACCAWRARSIASTSGRTARWCCATTRRARPARRQPDLPGRAPAPDPVLRAGGAAALPRAAVEAAFLDYVDGGRPVAFDPVDSTGERFLSLLRTLTSAIAAGRFVQEHSACRFCDFQAACGPQPLLELRRRFKTGDPHLREYLKLREWR